VFADRRGPVGDDGAGAPAAASFVTVFPAKDRNRGVVPVDKRRACRRRR
jgi:hypothetical protein